MNLVYKPDHEQVLEHHKELIKKAEQERFEHLAIATPIHPLSSIRKWLWHLISDRSAHEPTLTSSRISSTHL